MSSLYSQYINELTNNIHVIETEYGFVTYSYDNPNCVYIREIFIIKKYRNDKLASKLADMVVIEAKKHNCNILYGSVVPSNNNSTISLQVLLGYGMALDSSSNNFIVFKKEI